MKGCTTNYFENENLTCHSAHALHKYLEGKQKHGEVIDQKFLKHPETISTNRNYKVSFNMEYPK